MPRLTALLLALILAVVGAARAGATAVTEADLKQYRTLRYAGVLRDARQQWARGDQAKRAAAVAEYEKTFADSGWSTEEFGAVQEAINEALGVLSAGASGELSAEEVASALENCDPLTVASVKAHLDELRSSGDSERADKQVRDEIARAKAGTPPTMATLQGLWVYDAAASVIEILGSPDAGMQASLEKKLGQPSYRFGPGNAVETHGRTADGTEFVHQGVFRVEGDKIYFKAEGGSSESSLQAGIRGDKLLLGAGFGVVVFTRR